MRQLTATFLAWLLVAAAQPQALKFPKGTARFGATTQLVVEDVMVKGKDGNPVEGLKASDFTVSEDGKPQKIAVFEFQKLEEQAAPPPVPKPAVETAAPAVQPAVASQIAGEKPGDIKYKDRRLLVLFFDMTSMPIQDQIRSQNAAVKFLKTQMTASDLMAVMTFSSD